MSEESDLSDNSILESNLHEKQGDNCTSSYTRESVERNASRKAKRQHLSTMTAAERARKLGNEDFYADAAELFCKFCKKAVDHRSQSVINRHMISDKHTKNKRKDPNRKPANTITTAFKVSNAARLQNIRLVSNWVRSCAASNIPLNVSDNFTMRNFFRDHVVSGGSIPQRNGILPYLKDCYIVDREKLKADLSSKKVMLFFDETFDSQARYVSCALIAALPPKSQDLQPILADVFIEEEPLDGGKVSRQILKTLNNYSINFEDVAAYGTDNASYMLSSYKNSLQQILPNCVHTPCISHIMNLVVKDFMKSFNEVTTWAVKFPGYFSRSGPRKTRFLNFLKNTGYPVKGAPLPVATRWASMFDAIRYHNTYLQVEKAFIMSECLDDSNADSLEDLIMYLRQNYNTILFQCKFIELRAKPLINAMKLFESDLPLSCVTFSYLEKIKFELASQKYLIADSIQEFLVGTTKTLLNNNFVSHVRLSAEAAEQKFLKYFGDSGVYSSKEFLKDLQFLAPRTALQFPETPRSLSIPQSNTIPLSEMLYYRVKASEFVINVPPPEDTSDIDEIKRQLEEIREFWEGVAAQIPKMYFLAMTYGFIVPSSASVERVFSYFNKVLTEDRQKLAPETLKQLLFLYVNAEKNLKFLWLKSFFSE